jgi:hypothetical protein
VDERRQSDGEGDAPASHSKVLFRSGAPPRAAEVSELDDSVDAPVAAPSISSEGAPESSPAPEVAASRRSLKPAIAAIACAFAVVGGCVAVRLGALERPHLAPTVEDSTATELPAARAAEAIPGLGAHRLIPTTQPEGSGTRLRKYAPVRRPLAPRPR